MNLEDLMKDVEEEYNRLSAHHQQLMDAIRKNERRIIMLEGKIEALRQLNTENTENTEDSSNG